MSQREQFPRPVVSHQHANDKSHEKQSSTHRVSAGSSEVGRRVCGFGGAETVQPYPRENSAATAGTVLLHLDCQDVSLKMSRVLCLRELDDHLDVSRLTSEKRRWPRG